MTTTPLVRARHQIIHEPPKGDGVTSMPMSEATLQSSILGLARTCNWLAFHVHDSRKSTGPGFPDLVLCHKTTGRVIWAELKAEKGRVSTEQEEWLTALRTGGHTAGVWRPRHWDAELIQAALLSERKAA